MRNKDSKIEFIIDVVPAIVVITFIPVFVLIFREKSTINNWLFIVVMSSSIPLFYYSNKPKKLLNNISAEIQLKISFLNKFEAFTDQNYKCSLAIRITSIIFIAAFLVSANQFLTTTLNGLIDSSFSIAAYYISLILLLIFAGSLSLVIHLAMGFLGNFNERKSHLNHLLNVSYDPKSLLLFLLIIIEYWILSICCYASGWRPNYVVAQWIYNKKGKRKKKNDQQKINRLVKECLKMKTYKSSHSNQVYHFYKKDGEINKSQISKYLLEVKGIEYSQRAFNDKIEKSLNH